MGLFGRRKRKDDRSQEELATDEFEAIVYEGNSETIEEITSLAKENIWPGFSTLDSVLEMALEANEDSEEPLSDEVVEKIVRGQWKLRQYELASNSSAGSDDFIRLSWAFNKLEMQGILCRMNFTCCQTCGHSEIFDERKPERREQGYVFFHQQDSDRLGTDGEQLLYFAFGAFADAVVTPEDLKLCEDGDAQAQEKVKQIMTEKTLLVAQKLAVSLVEQGLDVQWDETLGTRPAIAITDWRKPLPE